MKSARYTGIVLSLLLVVAGFLHQNTVGFDANKVLLYISIGFAILHLGLFASKLNKPESAS